MASCDDIKGPLTITVVISPRQNSTATIMANPVAPLSIIVVKMAQGTFTSAFSISSDI